MKLLPGLLVSAMFLGCSENKHPPPKLDSNSSEQEVIEKTMVERFGRDAVASCRQELLARAKSQPLVIAPEAVAIKWQRDYLTGAREKTKQQFPESEAFLVTLSTHFENAVPQSQSTCQVVCLSKGACNTVGLTSKD